MQVIPVMYEAEFAAGLAPVVRAEIEQVTGTNGKLYRQFRESEIPFSYRGSPADLLDLQTVIAVYALYRFPVPRPKALLGHQNFQLLVNYIHNTMGIVGWERYHTLYLSAAGSDSAVMGRIKEEVAKATGLVVASDEGDLLLRLRPTPGQSRSWDALVRLTPRPLASRSWRVCNMEGALNAAVAQALVRLTRPRPTDTFLNIACGSGTIMIERAACMAAVQVIGCDIRQEALACARTNLTANNQTNVSRLMLCDGSALPLPDSSIDALCADLPFGQLVGSHDENAWLYPAILAEAARVARFGARLVVLTHEVQLMEGVLAQMDGWQVEEIIKITLSGLHPRVYVLERQT